MEETNPENIIRVMCVDDHPLVRKGIASILANEPDMRLVAEAENGHDAVESFKRHRPDVTLMDLRMPQLDGIAAARMIFELDPAAKIIALTSFDGDQEIYRALAAGVRGYLLKEMVHTEVLRAIRLVHAGKRLVPPEVARRLGEYSLATPLTKREIEVLSLVAKGLSNKEVGERLGTAAGTVKMHIENLLGKLQAADRTQAVTIAIQRGILRLDE